MEDIINNNLLLQNKNYISNDIEHYILGEKLGEGIFGTVKLGTHKITKEKVAIKILNKNLIIKGHKKLLKRELEIHKKLNHFNIIKVYSIIETESKIYLIQEYSEGKELSLYIQSHPNLEEKDICKFFQQIISGVEYLHGMGIVHRDLKPENILLTRTNDIKIIDFGLSNFYDKGQLLKTSCGSPYYAPPEMLKGKPYNGFYSDIYSCGIILYYMLTHKLPFNEKKESDTYQKILLCKFDIPKNVSKNAQDLLKKIIKLKPEERIKLPDIKNHPWFNLCNKENNFHNGLNIEKIIFPIDEEIINKMEGIGFNKMEVRYNIIINEHNNITATYYLLLNKKIKTGRKSVADLHSILFEEYIKDPKNQLENYENNLNEAIKRRINSKKILEIIPDFKTNQLQKKNIIYKNNDEVKLKNVNKIANKKDNIIKNNNNKKERKSISLKKENINIQFKPKLNNISLTKSTNKTNISIKINKNNNYLNKSINLSTIIKPKSSMINFKNNIIKNKISKKKPLLNKDIQIENISTLKNKQKNHIKSRLSTDTKNNKKKIKFNGIFTSSKKCDKNNIFETHKKYNLIKNKKKLPFIKDEIKVKHNGSNYKITHKKKNDLKMN